ncbi:MAG: carbonic anhydrase [Alphaproteobacteria bacterium]|nr:carbonic anhydrase [Alphaproteobacteria bacterium]MBM3653950.1 carbonic anhydrase [Alphaproteobacteria bacterium]
MADQELSPGAPTLPAALIEGYESFVSGRFLADHGRFEELSVKGQTPKTMVISCCDSRVAPEAIFSAGPGELFVLRNVAALVPPYEPDDHYHGASAALEYAVMALKVSDIVVLGHGQCGGVQAYAQIAADPDTPRLSHSDFIGDWIKMLGPAVDRLGVPPNPRDRHYVERLEFEAVKLTLRNLRSFPMIQVLEHHRHLQLHGALFRIMDGRLFLLDESTGAFNPVCEQAHAAAFAEARF